MSRPSGQGLVKKRLTKKHLAAIEADYKKGMPVEELAKKYDVSKLGVFPDKTKSRPYNSTGISK